MKSNFTTFIMMIIFILIISVIGIFGFIIWNEVDVADASVEPKDFKITVSETIDSLDTAKSTETQIETTNISENALNLIKDSKKEKVDNTKKIDFSNITIDKYYYNQLSEDAKNIYKAFTVNLENMKDGKYKIELGDLFSDILKKENGQDELGKIYQSAYEAFNYDNPEVFYLNANKMFLNIETTTSKKNTKYNVYINSGNQDNYYTDEFSSKIQVNNTIEQVKQIKNQIVSRKIGNTYQDIKMVHDYLVDNLEYDTSISKPHIYTIYGALVNKVCVCEGYARAFKYIMDELDIPCVMVMGTGTNTQGQTENHAWNYVKVNERWYAIDVTWDDPVVSGGGKASNDSRYRYFLKGLNSFNKDHIASGKFSPDGKIFTYPIISSEDYN